jgi:hypothetical protein
VKFEPEKKTFISRHIVPTTNTDTLAPSLYQWVETRSLEVFWLSSRPLLHLVGHHQRLSNVLERISRPSCEQLYATNTSHREHITFLYEYNLAHKKTHKRKVLFSSILLKHGRHLDSWNQPRNMRIRVCYLEVLFWKKNSCIYENGLGNGHPAPCSTFL